MASPSNRKAFKAASFYDSLLDAMDAHMSRQEAELLEILAPTRNRWLGLVSGHHYWEYQDGGTTDTNIATALNTKFLDHCGMVRVNFSSGGRGISCTIWVHHGVGGGASAGAPLLKLQKIVEWCEADVYLMGHQHKRVAAQQPRMYLHGEKDNLRFIDHPKVLVGAGSYLRGYMQGSGTYVEEKMLQPVHLGSPLLKIIPVAKSDHCVLEFEATI